MLFFVAVNHSKRKIFFKGFCSRWLPPQVERVCCFFYTCYCQMVFVVVTLSVFYLIFVFITNYYWTGDDAGHQLAQAGHPVEPAKLLADPRQSSAPGTTLF